MEVTIVQVAIALVPKCNGACVALLVDKTARMATALPGRSGDQRPSKERCMTSISRNSGRFGVCILAFVALMGSLLSCPANAQSAGATLTGIITDKSDA